MTNELLNHPGIITGAELEARERRNGMPEHLGRLWRYLNSHCRGKANMRMTAQIGEHLDVAPKNIVHQASALVRDYAKPIGSECAGEKRGIYVAVTRAEKNECAGQLWRRMMNTGKRLQAFIAAPMETAPPRQETFQF